MNSEISPNALTQWQQQAQQHLIADNYEQAVNLYEQAIESQPNVISYYWYLGLILLLQGKEIEAQMTWMLPLADVEEENIQTYTQQLIQILQLEAERRENLEEFSLAWVIRQHIRELNNYDINNLLIIVQLSFKTDNFQEREFEDLGIIELLNTQKNINLNLKLLLQVLKNLFETSPLNTLSIDFIQSCLPYVINTPDFAEIFSAAVMKIGHTFAQPATAARLLELYLTQAPNNLKIILDVLRHLSLFYQNANNYSQGIEKAKLCLLLSTELADKLYATHLVLRGLLTAGGYWEEICLTSQQLAALRQEFIIAQPFVLNEAKTLSLLTPSFAIPHLQDSPDNFRKTHNQLAKICQNNLRAINHQVFERYFQSIINHRQTAVYNKKLKIGYVSYALKRHSVGWLARWLFQHHNRDKFEIYTYLINYNPLDDFAQEWYVNKADIANKLGITSLEVSEKIYADKIDILVDLDSITLDISCAVMALKPAPIQVTWLGWDASGIPAIDYFIADPYVLPDSAQDYYTEKILRLPQTYIAVDGFEVGIPTLRRNELDIPSNAVVYLSAQRGYKRHPETTRWQMKIIKEVPNSYFLIKGDAEEEAIKQFFYKIAAEEGVECSRLRFLSQDSSEAVHRANLTIADIVLDTFPYNGATTTLETLWMGIPLVTRVGQQFAARNSYTMMMNAGITEGIAWTDEEYVEWGVRLGNDEALRQQVVLKLKASRQTAPLWNGKQFTREMEKAYEQMWQRYIEEK
ncbi:O-linked N-acetylglucosamine transferase, SPINDLY family protein [aff. Roholtiella sp. LEGE 12411]|uniref:O-linked N-acetylglucosamine transferase, SPINDLY family protein n=1 Tax=aff. Roholtiella sp. LEGE 12411 TaxID=1828822 RepID=UPI0018827D2B|nr:O-linked N-acetylglucosamine transferase, SPINDLY family protein [aff. Roholtiella sp. LEGE 12411]MBE9037326.1 O-linked N-acetylglucosamine transferase, SPINDLY family protein [aff. Roholtiella sp. LEGE 12411]